MSPARLLEDDQAEQALLAAADDAFHRRGVGAVTMAELRDRSGVSLRRIYALHPTKSELITAWLRYRHRRWIDWFRTEIDERTGQGATTADAVFDALGQWLADTDFRGCAFLNTLAESSTIEPEHRRIIRDHKQDLVDHLAAHVADPAAMAVLIDGAMARAAVFGDRTPVEDARRLAAGIPSLAG